MLFQNSMKKILAEQGYRHTNSDEEFSHHGDYARNIQYAFSQEHVSSTGQKVVEIIFIGFDVRYEKFVIGFYRENTSIENGILENSEISIPLAKFSLEEFEKQLKRMLPKGSRFKKKTLQEDKF